MFIVYEQPNTIELVTGLVFLIIHKVLGLFGKYFYYFSIINTGAEPPNCISQTLDQLNLTTSGQITSRLLGPTTNFILAELVPDFLTTRYNLLVLPDLAVLLLFWK